MADYASVHDFPCQVFICGPGQRMRKHHSTPSNVIPACRIGEHTALRATPNSFNVVIYLKTFQATMILNIQFFTPCQLDFIARSFLCHEKFSVYLHIVTEIFCII